MCLKTTVWLLCLSFLPPFSFIGASSLPASLPLSFLSRARIWFSFLRRNWMWCVSSLLKPSELERCRSTDGIQLWFSSCYFPACLSVSGWFSLFCPVPQWPGYCGVPFWPSFSTLSSFTVLILRVPVCRQHPVSLCSLDLFQISKLLGSVAHSAPPLGWHTSHSSKWPPSLPKCAPPSWWQLQASSCSDLKLWNSSLSCFFNTRHSIWQQSSWEGLPSKYIHNLTTFQLRYFSKLGWSHHPLTWSDPPWPPSLPLSPCFGLQSHEPPRCLKDTGWLSPSLFHFSAKAESSSPG